MKQYETFLHSCNDIMMTGRQLSIMVRNQTISDFEFSFLMKYFWYLNKRGILRV